MLENDLVEAIIGLPSQLFYNTDIAIYAFILSKGKRKERKGKVQFLLVVAKTIDYFFRDHSLTI